MANFTCDVCDKVEVDVGHSNPTLVICAECNKGAAVWNCVDVGNFSCDCVCCGPSGHNPPESPEPLGKCVPPEDWDDDDIPF